MGLLSFDGVLGGALLVLVALLAMLSGSRGHDVAGRHVSGLRLRGKDRDRNTEEP
jgi:hypothetical protein